MIQDKQLEFSASQAITGSAASQNQIDTGGTVRGGYGMGDVEIVLTADQTFTAAGAATLTVQLRSSPNANMSGPTVHYQSPPIALADLAVGRQIPFLARFQRNGHRYVDLNYIVTTGPFTAGQLTARGTAARQLDRVT